MTGASILPVGVHEGKLYFLFGKENEMEDSAHGFSDFGGGVDKGENVYETSLREGSEELTGFLGDKTHLKKLIAQNGGVFRIVYKNSDEPERAYHVHIFALKYDANLPLYYNSNHSFLWKHMNKDLLNKSKLFEKIEIRWVCEDELQKNMGMYRPFYCNVVNLLVENIQNIRKFIFRNIHKTSIDSNQSFIQSKTRGKTLRGKQQRRRRHGKTTKKSLRHVPLHIHNRRRKHGGKHVDGEEHVDGGKSVKGG
jgi:hypothetical protein